MAAVGLAQNFAAIRALATDGIQKGHMRMHARSTKTRQSATPQLHPDPHGSAAGKVILVGEHAAVYGKHVLALPIPSAVTARIVEQGGDESRFVNRLLHFIKQQLAIDDDGLGAEIRSTLLPGMGLGVSAAMAVAVIRAINHVRELGMDDDAINRLAFACEKTAHGNPSGIDNTIATFAKPVLFSNAAEPAFQVLDLNALPPLLIAYSTQRGSTREQVAAVHTRYVAQAQHYDALFDSIDAMSLAAVDALRSTNYEVLGSLMNTAHGVLNAIGVSTPELEGMVAIARAAGATGAKLTGSGGGGSIVALCPGTMDEVAAALQAASYDTLTLYPQ
jgi:hydroxymethylglutaryl-CoA reductase